MADSPADFCVQLTEQITAELSLRLHQVGGVTDCAGFQFSSLKHGTQLHYLPLNAIGKRREGEREGKGRERARGERG